MSRKLRLTQLMQLVLPAILLFAAFESTSAQEVKEERRPLLEIEGNQIFSKQELLDVVNNQLDEWAKAGSKYSRDQLDYCIHQMDFFMKSRGYLQGRVVKQDFKVAEAGPRLVLTVTEGPLYRVGETTLEGARLFPSELILDTIGLRTGDIANGKGLSEGLFGRLKTRYSNFGYVQYTAEVQPTFHAKEDAKEGVVDLKITIDEGDQFRIHSLKISGAESRVTDLLARELLLRSGDVFDDQLFHESVNRLNRTGLVEPIDAEKDVEWTNLQDKQRRYDRKLNTVEEGPPLLDLLIHVRKASHP